MYSNVSAPHTPCRHNYAHGCAVFTGRCRDLSEHQKWRPSAPGLGVTWGGQPNVATLAFTVAAATVMAIGFVRPAASSAASVSASDAENLSVIVRELTGSGNSEHRAVESHGG